MPIKVTNHTGEKLIEICLGCEIYEWQGRYFAYRYDYRIGELINGKDGLIKYYKNNSINWIKKLKYKDLDKITKMKDEANQILQQCKELEDLWK
jgi:hypothetical protein